MFYKTLASYAFFILSIIFINFVLVLKVPDILGYATNVKTADLLVFTNDLREKNGLDSLKLNNTLSKAAFAKANDMFNEDYWAHTSPSGKEPWDFIIGSGYDYIYAGENLAVDFSKSEDVVKAWNNSPSHRDNLLSSKYVDVGYAVVDGELQGRKTTLIVQMFGYKRGSQQVATLPLAANSGVEPIIPDVFVEPQPLEVDEIVVEDKQVSPPVLDQPITGSVLSAVTVMSASKYIAIILGLFLSLFFAIDWFYVKNTGILRISGHTIFHIIILVIAMIGIWYTNIGLVL